MAFRNSSSLMAWMSRSITRIPIGSVNYEFNTWSFGGEYLQTYKPYGEKGRIPVAQFSGEVGYNLHLVSDYSQTFHLYAGASAFGGYETVNWGKSVLSDGSTLHDGDAFIYGGSVLLA